MTFSLRPGVRAARRAYYAAAAQAFQTADDFDGPQGRHASSRARMLSGLAALEQSMAGHVRNCGWGHVDDLLLAAEHEDTALLLTVLASTEVVPAGYARSRGPAEWEDAFGTVLDALARQSDLTARAELMTRLYVHARPILGEAIETVTMIRDGYARLAGNALNPATGEVTAS